jgi:hypothetical protein
MGRNYTLVSLRRRTTTHEANTCEWNPGDLVIHAPAAGQIPPSVAT